MLTTKADKYFSMYIRLRDADENGLAKCCTCGAYKPVKEMDCGHFIKRQHMATRFSEVNCATQCKRCNAFEQGRDAEFERYIIDRWGVDKLNLLKSSYHKPFKRGLFDIDLLAKYYKEKAQKLAIEKGIELW
ncbi:MAG: recombination protein NinG [Smithella sp.]